MPQKKPEDIPQKPDVMPNLKLRHFLPYRLSVLSNRISRAIAQHYSDRFGLSLPEWRVMAILGEHEDHLTAADLVTHTAMDKVAVSRAVRALVDRGLIARKEDLKDRRRTPLVLTKPGRDIYEDVAPLALAYEADLLASLPATDRQTLDRIIDHLSDRMDAQSQED